MNIPFSLINWNEIEDIVYPGETGHAYWQTVQMGGIRIRRIRYSENYTADHWCQKGHIVHCLEGNFTSEMETGEKFILNEGIGYVVSDDMSSHRSVSTEGAVLLIIDGYFLEKDH